MKLKQSKVNIASQQPDWELFLLKPSRLFNYTWLLLGSLEGLNGIQNVLTNGTKAKEEQYSHLPTKFSPLLNFIFLHPFILSELFLLTIPTPTSWNSIGENANDYPFMKFLRESKIQGNQNNWVPQKRRLSELIRPGQISGSYRLDEELLSGATLGCQAKWTSCSWRLRWECLVGWAAL